MRFLKLFFIVAVLASCARQCEASMVFNLVFDTTFDQALNGDHLDPTASATISCDDNLGDGTYLISSLRNFTLTATIHGNTFTMAHAIFDTTNLALTIYTKPRGQDIFADGPTVGSVTGGSLELLIPNTAVLSFETNDLSAP